VARRVEHPAPAALATGRCVYRAGRVEQSYGTRAVSRWTARLRACARPPASRWRGAPTWLPGAMLAP